MRMAAERIPALDGVRALAVLGVIASHAGLFGLGWVGVDVFFGLSGYLITGIAVGVGAGLVIAVVRRPRMLQWRWLSWIGQISYGVYVIHAVFGAWLHSRFTLAQAPLIFVIQIGLTLPLAAASWYCFESPILRLKRHWPMPSAEPGQDRAVRTSA